MLTQIVVFAPFVGAILLGALYLFAPRIPQNLFAALGMSAPIVSFIAMFALFSQNWANIDGFLENSNFFSWIAIGDFKLDFGFYVDKLSLVMGTFVCFLAMLIHLYSIGYMDKEKGFGKFFCYMNLFLGSMLVLVFANSPLFMFFGWEGVGACSYLLIAFYFEGKDNVKAGNKAFIVNRIGDLGFIVGLSTLYIAASGAFDYEALKTSSIAPSLAIFIGFCFMCGALAKSAQLPLYTWLPDAMAGPTPISALIHAATMVTAGVYMVVRFEFLYANLSVVLETLAIIGAVGALFAAIIATRARDIKKILAYSTMSQLGYMFAALAFSKSSALFHLFTHGFFKALLFLGAGAVIIALHHEQDIFKMGGLKKEKILFYPMLFGLLAIAGIPPFAGFFSKDEILLGAWQSGHLAIFAILLFTAGLTAYYMFRLFFLVFFSENSSSHPHEIPLTMKIVNITLCFFALGGGVLMSYVLGLHSEHNATSYIIASISVFVALIGIFIAYKKFYAYKNAPESENAVIKFISNKFLVDELYDFVFVKSFKKLSDFSNKIFEPMLYAITLLVALSLRAFSGFYTNITQHGLANKYAYAMIFWVAILAIYIKVSL